MKKNKYDITCAVGSQRDDAIEALKDTISYVSFGGRNIIVENTPEHVGTFHNSCLILVCDEKGEVVVASERLLFKHPKLVLWLFKLYVHHLKRIISSSANARVTCGSRHIDITVYQRWWHSWQKERKDDEQDT